MSEAVVDRILIAIGLDTKQVDKGMATVQNKLVTGLSGIASKLFAPLLAGVTLSFGANILFPTPSITPKDFKV